jgi:hypothetical protein
MPRGGSIQHTTAPEALLQTVGALVKGLEGVDAFTFWSAVSTVLLTCLPWKSTAAEGDLIGLVTLGLCVTFASIGTAVGVLLRARSHRRYAVTLLPWALQLGTASFSLLWTLLCIHLAHDPNHPEVGAAAGAYLSLLSVGASIVGTVVGMREGL